MRLVGGMIKAKTANRDKVGGAKTDQTAGKNSLLIQVEATELTQNWETK